jgi:outer membrane protein assembly factor BamA
VSVPGLNLQDAVPEGPGAREVMRPVLIKVKEQKSLEMEIGGGYDSDTGFEGFLSLQESNLFHRAQRVNLDGLLGEKKWEGSLAYTVPTLFGYRLTGTVEGKHKRELYEAFTEEESVGTAALTRTFREIFTPSLCLTIKKSSVFDVVAVGPGAPAPADTTNLFFHPRFQLDTRDDRIYPTRGFFLTAGVSVSGRDVGSSDNLIISSARVSGYHSFFPKWTLAATASTDFVDTYGETKQVPSTELLFAGGNDSVRGFPRQSLGPVDILGTPLGGTTRVLGSVEFRFPIYRLLHGYVFVDVGSLTHGWSRVTWDTFRWTSGGGVRLYTPVGPLCLGYGIQLQPNPPLDRGEILFSLGFAY